MHQFNLRFSAVAVLLALAAPMLSHAQDVTTASDPIYLACNEPAKLCVWTQGREIHVIPGATTEWLAGGILAAQDPKTWISPRLDAKIVDLRAKYRATHQHIQRNWTTAARSIVSNVTYANISTLTTAVYDVTTTWTNHISAKLTHDSNSSRDPVMSVVFPLASVVAYNFLPIGALTIPLFASEALTVFNPPIGSFTQNVVFQLMARYAIPAFFSSTGYVWTDIPGALSAQVHDLRAEEVEAVINEATQALLTQTTLRYLMMKDGARQLAQDSQDQGAQNKLLAEMAGKPMLLGTAIDAMRNSRDFRLVYAAKIAPIVRENYSQELNNFIVTGHFSELNWVSTGASAYGVIYDLYLPDGEPQFKTTYGFPVDNRRKRTWEVDYLGRLKAKDHGPLIQGRLFERVRLILPYWDEAVRSPDSGSPLKGNPNDPGAMSDSGHEEFESADQSNFTPPTPTNGHHR